MRRLLRAGTVTAVVGNAVRRIGMTEASTMVAHEFRDVGGFRGVAAEHAVLAVESEFY